MTDFRTPEHTRRLVRVEGREDIGEVIDAGHNFGSMTPVYCIGVHFPKDGLCAYYDAKRVSLVAAT